MRAVDISKNERYVEIFKKLVEIYVETGEAVGSRTIAKQIESSLSPATVRNVMADLDLITHQREGSRLKKVGVFL